MVRRKSITTIVLLVVLLSAFVAPAAIAQEKEWVIGASLMNTQEPFYLDLEQGWRDAAEDLGVELVITSAENDLAAQIAQTEDFITRQVDAIILIPADTAGIVPAVEKANEAGIPVFTADNNSDGGDIVSFIASDNYQGGVLAAQWLAQEIGGKGQVVVLGHPSITSNFQRISGFRDTIEKNYPDIEIVQEFETEFTRDDAIRKAEDALVTYPDLAGIFGATGGDAGIGALSAVEAAGRDNVKIVNFDAIPESRQIIFDGSTILTGDAAQFPYDIGYESLATAVAYLKGEEVPPVKEIDVALVTKDNLIKVGDKLYVAGHEEWPVPEGDRVVIGASLMNTQEPFYLDLEQGWRDAAEEFNAEVLVTSAEMDIAAQISHVEDYIVKGVDAMILIPPDSAGIVPAVENANAAGIPVFTADIASEGGEVVCHIASDNYMGGVLAAEAMAELLGEEGGQVVILGHPSVTSNYQRMVGFTDTVAQRYPQIEVVQEYETQFARDDAIRKTEDALVTYPDLRGIYGAFGGDAGMGALAAVEAAGKKPGEIVIVNFDAIPESREAIYNENPFLVADVAQFPYDIGYQSMKVAIAYLRGAEFPKEIEVEVGLVTKENLVEVDGKLLIAGHEVR